MNCVLFPVITPLIKDVGKCELDDDDTELKWKISYKCPETLPIVSAALYLNNRILHEKMPTYTRSEVKISLGYLQNTDGGVYKVELTFKSSRSKVKFPVLSSSGIVLNIEELGGNKLSIC